MRLHALPLVLILVTAAALRLCWVTWDGGLWLHPDERQIYFVANSLAFPKTLSQAFSASSPLNPHFFAYGSLPIYLVRLAALLLAPLCPALRDPDNLHLVGRPLAALFGVATVALVCRLGARLEVGRAATAAQGETPRRPSVQTPVGLLSAALFGLAVLPIQSSHFYTADGLVTFFVMLSLSLAADVAHGAGRSRFVALGLAVGLALATKLSAVPILFVIPVLFSPRGPLAPRLSRRERLSATALTLVIAAVAFLLAEPYAVLDRQTFLADTLRESQIASGRLDVPYTRQFTGTLPYLYSAWQTALWGMGLPMGLLGWTGLAATLVRWLRLGEWADSLLLAWAGPYFALTGALYARPLRYMLPLIPVLCVLGSRLAARISLSAAGRRWLVVGGGLVLLSSLAYTLAFVSVYASAHSWIAASEWIYRHVPVGCSLAVEEWDTPLPLPIEVDGRPRRSEEYNLRTLVLYEEPDGEDKWLRLVQDLAASDYVIIASRRLYGSISRLPGRYPLTSRYYSLLFEGTLGFELAGEFTRGAAWLNPPVAPHPGAVPSFLVPDESLVVNDRPRVILFRNSGHLSAADLLARLGLAGE